MFNMCVLDVRAVWVFIGACVSRPGKRSRSTQQARRLLSNMLILRFALFGIFSSVRYFSIAFVVFVLYLRIT